MADSTKPLVFVSYAHADEPQQPREHEVQWLSWVKSQFAPLDRLGVVEYFTDQKLLAAQDWEARILENLAHCDLFILLVSPGSLGSNFIVNTEVKAIIERQKANGSTEQPLLLPIVLKSVDDRLLNEFEWLKTPNRRPRDGKALSELPMTGGVDLRTRAMAEIVGDVLELLKKLIPQAGNVGASAVAPRMSLAVSATAPILAAQGAAAAVAPPKIIDLSALPDTSLVTLRGREAELARLDVAWDDPGIHVFSVVAWGGQGKSALVLTWADRLKAEGGRGAEALLAWSFYDQGTKEREPPPTAFSTGP